MGFTVLPQDLIHEPWTAWRRRCQEGYNETAFWKASLGARRRADWKIKRAGVKNPFSTMPGK